MPILSTCFINVLGSNPLFNGSKVIFLILYVDDILLTTNDLGLLHETKKFLSNNFEMKDMSEVSYMIRI